MSRKSTLSSLLCRLAATWLLIVGVNNGRYHLVTAWATSPAGPAPGLARILHALSTPRPSHLQPGNAFAPSRAVARMLARVEQAAVYGYTAQLSGAAPALVGGRPYIFTTRNTRSGEPIAQATQFAFEHLQADGLATTYFEWSAPRLDGRNVIATLTGTVHPDEIVLVTAHLDSLSDEAAAPGADDDASGSAAVLVAADVMSRNRFERTVRFVLFTGEEQGALGSSAYAREIADAGADVVAVYHMDMIGWDSDSDGRLLVHTREQGAAGYAGDLTIAGVLTNVVAAYGLDATLSPEIRADGDDASDHWSFWQQGYAAVLAVEDDGGDFNDSNHTAGDRLEYLNLPYFTAFVKASVGTVAHLAEPLETEPRQVEE
jgi:hypothetical protein